MVDLVHFLGAVEITGLVGARAGLPTGVIAADRPTHRVREEPRYRGSCGQSVLFVANHGRKEKRVVTREERPVPSKNQGGWTRNPEKCPKAGDPPLTKDKCNEASKTLGGIGQMQAEQPPSDAHQRIAAPWPKALRQLRLARLSWRNRDQVGDLNPLA